MNPFQNPIHWTRQHQLAWIIVSTFGAILGLLLGFSHSPGFSAPQVWGAFVDWLSFPKTYWRWPIFGFLGTGIIFYAAQLFRRSN
jgi:hypothetical protein